MKLHFRYLAILMVIYLVLCSSIYAQEVGDYVRIKLLSGSVLKGTIIELTDDDVQLSPFYHPERVESISRAEIESISKITNIERAVMPDAGLYFWGTNGYSVEEGRLYFRNQNVLCFGVEYGVTERLEVGATFLFLTSVSFNTGYRIPIRKNVFNIKVGVQVSIQLPLFVDESDVSNSGFVYGVATLGPPTRNITAGVLWEIISTTATAPPSPSLYVAGRYDFTPRWSVQSEMLSSHSIGVQSTTTARYILDGDDLFSFGFLLLINSFNKLIPFPMLGYTAYFE